MNHSAANTRPLAFAASGLTVLRTALIALAGLAVASTQALAHEYKLGDLEIAHPWSRATLPGAKVATGYLVIKNNGTTDDRLLSVTAEISGKAEIHEMKMTDGVMSMRPVKEGVEIPAGGEVKLEPQSYHIMFMELNAPAVEGDKIPRHVDLREGGHGVCRVRRRQGRRRPSPPTAASVENWSLKPRRVSRPQRILAGMTGPASALEAYRHRQMLEVVLMLARHACRKLGIAASDRVDNRLMAVGDLDQVQPFGQHGDRRSRLDLQRLPDVEQKPISGSLHDGAVEGHRMFDDAVNVARQGSLAHQVGGPLQCIDVAASPCLSRCASPAPRARRERCRFHAARNSSPPRHRSRDAECW